jgi:hypothetical protein
MGLEDNTSLRASFPTLLAGETQTQITTEAEEEEELAELEFEEDQPDTRVVNPPMLSHPASVSQEEEEEEAEAEKEEWVVQAQAELALPLIFQQNGLDLVLKLHPQPQAQLWVGLRSGQQPPLLRVFDELDLAKLASQLVPLLEEYARHIEAAKPVKAEAPSKPKVEGTLPAVVPPSQKPAVQPASLKPTLTGLTDKDKEKDKDLEQLSFF